VHSHEFSTMAAPNIDFTIGGGGNAVLRPMMWMFLAVLVTFLLTRVVTRMIRAGTGSGLGNVSVGGIHVHHQVFGILIMIGTGIALLAATPEGAALSVAGAVFGIGVGLTLDEFALWLHLRDVYWSSEGRQSVDAVFCVLVVTGALIGGADFITGRVGTTTWWASVGFLSLTLALSVICLLKGKVVTGVTGIVLWPIAVAGAIRLAKPDSWWSRRHYTSRSRRDLRAHARFNPRHEARWNRLRDFVAGAPNSAPAGQRKTTR
jgi:hypothetical protein